MVQSYPKAYLYRRIVQAKLFIDTNYSLHIDMNNIAHEAFFSKFHFIREFKRIYSRTPHQYLISVRIDAAVVLLHKKMSISDVCYAVGFESLSSFSGLFKRMTGFSPSAFLLQQQKRKAQIQKAPFYFVPGCFSEKKKSNFEEDIPGMDTEL